MLAIFISFMTRVQLNEMAKSTWNDRPNFNRMLHVAHSAHWAVFFLLGAKFHAEIARKYGDWLVKQGVLAYE